MIKLKNKILNKISSNNNYIPIDEFIELAMYDKKYGYYLNKNPIGKNGDFITSPEISQLFGELIGLYIYDYWKKNINKNFSLVELGPGKGTFLKDLLRISSNYKNYLPQMNLKLIEKNKTLIKLQKKILTKNKEIGSVEWLNDLDNSFNEKTIFFANEFFDCFPIKQIFKYRNNYFEKVIKYNKKYRKFIIRNLKINDEKELIKKVELIYNINNFKDESLIEISPSTDKYIDKIGNILIKNKGIAIIIDYGYYISKGFSTIQSVKNHKMTNFLLNPGDQDITHLIDFSYIKNMFESIKLISYGPFTQRDFFVGIGIEEYKNKIFENSSSKQKTIIEEQYKKLIDNKFMGELFKILIISSEKLDLYE